MQQQEYIQVYCKQSGEWCNVERDFAIKQTIPTLIYDGGDVSIRLTRPITSQAFSSYYIPNDQDAQHIKNLSKTGPIQGTDFKYQFSFYSDYDPY